MDSDDQRRATSFGQVARQYAEFRPGYPPEAAGWLVGPDSARVLELGAGTGKLTGPLTALGHKVVATDPSTDMLQQLRTTAPGARRAAARAEQIPLGPSAVDVVVSAQAFHWFDTERALPEIARVLRPGGILATIWNAGDFKVPWVRKVLALIGLPDEPIEDPVAGSELFETRDQRTFRHWQRFDRESLIGYVSSSSYVAVRPADEREELLREVGAIYDSYGRGSSGMLMPWRAICFRAAVTGLADAHRASATTHDDGLLIDFN